MYVKRVITYPPQVPCFAAPTQGAGRVYGGKASGTQRSGLDAEPFLAGVVLALQALEVTGSHERCPDHCRQTP